MEALRSHCPILLLFLHTDHCRPNRQRRRQAFVPGLWLWTSQAQTQEAAEETVQPCSGHSPHQNPEQRVIHQVLQHRRDLHQPPSSPPREQQALQALGAAVSSSVNGKTPALFRE